MQESLEVVMAAVGFGGKRETQTVGDELVEFGV